jgi:hypothetical protein
MFDVIMSKSVGVLIELVPSCQLARRMTLGLQDGHMLPMRSPLTLQVFLAQLMTPTPCPGEAGGGYICGSVGAGMAEPLRWPCALPIPILPNGNLESSNSPGPSSNITFYIGV